MVSNSGPACSVIIFGPEAIPNDYYILYGKKLVPYSMLKQNLFGSILKDSFVQHWPATLFKF